MQNKLHTIAAIGLLAGICLIGAMESLQAKPDGSQRLRGLGDRVFAVHVNELTGNLGPWEFDNCYIFEADGTFLDPLFLDPSFIVPGTWEQHSNGAKTTYSATAEFAELGYLLEQQGMVTPAHGSGTLQIEAYSAFFEEGQLFLEFLAIGNEVDECPYF